MACEILYRHKQNGIDAAAICQASFLSGNRSQLVTTLTENIVNKGAYAMTTVQKSEPPTRILLIEDNEANRRLMGDYLSYCGYSVCALSEGTQLASVMEEFQPQIILLDLKLPTIDGYTLLTQIRQRADWQTVPVIVVSAYAFQRDQQRALELGARRYLVKPIRLSQLTDVIREELATDESE
jgi:CheY-like chemotaxis protein